MRREFLEGLTLLAEEDERIVLLTADLGFGSIEVFADSHPARFFNVGVSEQAMIGYATGLAEAGLIPYCYSIASFAVARTFEFLRNGPISHRLPVRVIGIGPGVDYGTDGHTHHALEDVSLLLTQPNSVIVSPRDGISARNFGSAHLGYPGLVYYRLARSSQLESSSAHEGVLDPEILVIAFGDTVVLGSELCSLSSRPSRLIVSEVLSDESIETLIRSCLESTAKTILVLENQLSRFGLASFIGERLLTAGWSGRFLKWGFADDVLETFGDEAHLVAKCAPRLPDLLKVLDGQ